MAVRTLPPAAVLPKPASSAAGDLLAKCRRIAGRAERVTSIGGGCEANAPDVELVAQVPFPCRLVNAALKTQDERSTRRDERLQRHAAVHHAPKGKGSSIIIGTREEEEMCALRPAMDTLRC